MKNTFVGRALEFLRNYFSSLVDFMIRDKSYFSQSLDKSSLGLLRKAYCHSLNLLLCREAREFANELTASTKASRNTAAWLEGSSRSSQGANSADISNASEAFFIVLLCC